MGHSFPTFTFQEKMKKKVIIVSHGLRIGGVERSLIGILRCFDYNSYDVDLFLFIHDGEFMSMIPKEVNLLPENGKYASVLMSLGEIIKKTYFDILGGKIIATFLSDWYCRKNKLKQKNMVYSTYLQKYTSTFLPEINNKEYDLAISFLTPHYIVADKVKSRKRVAWIHTDYSFFDFDKKVESKMWHKYDFIASISESCTKSFITQFPELKEKIVLIENILSPSFVREQAKAIDVESEIPKEKDIINICSIGRFSHPKNFDNVPFICKYLIDWGMNVRWYLIGYGRDEALICSKIAEAGMQNRVVVLGKKENPYPYLNACDIYMQPSRYEGKAVTVREAQMLCKPVIITDFATSASQLQDGIDGIIVPMNNEDCAKGIQALIKNKSLQQKLTANCQNSNFGNEKEVEKIYKLIM